VSAKDHVESGPVSPTIKGREWIRGQTLLRQRKNHRKSPHRKVRSPFFGVDTLENRRLLSATLALSNGLMVFNAVEDSSVSPQETLTLTNSGDAPLSLTGLTVINDPSQTNQGAARFTLVNANSAPASLAVGASFTLDVDYSAKSVGLDYALLNIASSDPNNPVEQVQLHGIGTSGLGGGNQPSLELILKAYDQPNYANVGESNINSAYYPEPPANGSEEVPLQEMEKAGSGPVTIDVLASFTASASSPYTLGWYNTASLSTSKQVLFHTLSSEAQSVYIQPQGITSFDPGSSIFGFYNPSATVMVNGQLVTGYSQDEYNTWDTTDPRKFRFFPLINSAGNAVPNSYIMTSTEWYDPAGYDFTNMVAIVSNVMPVPSGTTSPVLSINNPDQLPASDTLLFNRIQIPNAIVGDDVHDTNTITLTNSGGGDLTISNITVAGTTASNGGTQYVLVNPPAMPFTLTAGESQPIEIQFVLNQGDAGGHNPTNETNSADMGAEGSAYPGILTITSNSTVAPTVTIPMEGYWQQHSENENEPNLQTMVNLMAGYSTEIDSSSSPFLTESYGSGSDPVYYGEEVVSPYWAEADASQPVSVIQLAAFHTQGDTAGLDYYAQGSNTGHNILETGSDVGQAFFPVSGSSDFSTGGNFGFEVLNPNTYSDDSKNPSADGGGHMIRFYPLRDANGTLVPNTYILACDYPNGANENFDYNDNVYIISNIHPVSHVAVTAPQTTGGAAAISSLTATDTSGGVQLQWVPIVDSSLTGYNVYTSLSATGGFSLLATAPATASGYLDTTALPNETIYYRVSAVDSIGPGLPSQVSVTTTGSVTTDLQSLGIGESPAGNTTVISPDQAYTVVAGGPGVTGTSDGFQYTYTTGLGDFDVSMQVSSLTVAGNFSTAGIMARDSLATTAANVYMSASPADYRFKYRDADGGTEQVTPGTSPLVYPAVWVRLTRVGDVFTGYYSADDIVWTMMQQETLPDFPTLCYLGIAVASNSTTTTTTAQLANYGTTQLHQGPIAEPDSYTAYSGQAVNESVLANDLDISGTIDPATFAITAAPSAGGTAIFNPSTGFLTYQSAPGFVGVETLMYTIADNNGLVSPPALISFNVASGSPVAVADTFKATASEPISLNVLANDIAPVAALNPATVTIVAPPTSGATVTVDPTTGLITYTAPDLFAGTDTFTYDVQDTLGEMSNLGTVTVTVSQPRIILKPTSATAMLDQTAVIKVLAGSSDAGGSIQDNTVTIVSPPAVGSVVANTNGTVSYTPAAGTVGPATFMYTVADNKGRVSTPQLVTVNVGVNVGSAAGDYRTLTFTSGGGATSTLSLSLGTMVVTFTQPGMLSVDKHNHATITGSSLEIAGLAISGTNPFVALSIKSTASGTLDVGGITDASSLKSFIAPRAILSGTINVKGIGTMQALALNDAKVTLAKGLASFTMNVPQVIDSTLNVAVPIKSIKVGSWSSSNVGSSSITTPSIQSLMVTGDFQSSLKLTSGGIDLQSAQIKGTVDVGTWNLSGNVQTMMAGAIGSTLDATVAGTIKTLTVLGGDYGSITAGHATTIKVNGSINPGAALNFTGAGTSLNMLNVAGSISGASVNSTGNIGTISAALLSDDTILIGAVAYTTLADVSSASIGSARLARLQLNAKNQTTFSNTTLIVHTIATGNLGTVDTTNPGGVATMLASSLTGAANGSVFHFNTRAKASDTFGAFEIDVVTSA
jgi:hypothetical protein